MITDNNKKLAQWAMDFALKGGCQAAKVMLYANSNTSYQLRNAKMDRLKQASEMGMRISVYVDGRYGNYSTNRLNKSELESFISNGIESTRYLAKDEYRVLADAERYYKGGKPDLQLFDSSMAKINPDEKIALARASAEEVMGKDERIISVETSFGEYEGTSYSLISNGFEGESQSTTCSISASVSVKGEGDARPSDYWYESDMFYNTLTKTDIGSKALQRVLRKLGQKKAKSGKYTMVMDTMVSSRMLSPVLNALYGSALQQKNSFLIDKLNEKVVSDKLTLIDDPHVIGARGSRYFDGEGVATERSSIFEGGVLKTYFIDTYNAKKMGVAPTLSGPSRLVLTPGSKGLNELVADVSSGILVTGLNGGNSNSSTGDFSYGVEGFLIENGKLTQPVSEMNITGNFITLWASLAAIGNDARKSSSWLIPSLVFEGVDFSGA